MSVVLHEFITQYNPLKQPTQQLNRYFTAHKTLYKMALVANHLFRTISMAAFMIALPFSVPVNAGICLAASLFYRLTVETHCAYKFALPAYFGATALLSSNLPLTIAASALYSAYMILTVNYDVDCSRCH